jgi:hypothetical protein
MRLLILYNRRRSARLVIEHLRSRTTELREYLSSRQTPRHTKATASNHIDAAADYEVCLNTLREDRGQRLGRDIRHRVARRIHDLRRDAVVVHWHLDTEAGRILAIRHVLTINLVGREAQNTLEAIADSLL